jgi:hypothetical protein
VANRLSFQKKCYVIIVVFRIHGLVHYLQNKVFNLKLIIWNISVLQYYCSYLTSRLFHNIITINERNEERYDILRGNQWPFYMIGQRPPDSFQNTMILIYNKILRILKGRSQNIYSYFTRHFNGLKIAYKRNERSFTSHNLLSAVRHFSVDIKHTTYSKCKSAFILYKFVTCRTILNYTVVSV